MTGLWVTCPLCGFAFEPAEAPSGAAIHLALCPHCEFEFPEDLPTSSWFRRPLPKKEEREVLPMEGPA